MDFYSAQDSARRNSRWLIVWFLIAVVLLIGIANFLIALLIYLMGAGTTAVTSPEAVQGFIAGFTWETFGFVTLAVVGTVFLVILFKWAQLSAGGKSVAERLGGERILPHTEDSKQRRCLNVVEEMSLAAGLPVPPVYLLAGEQGINAFAAGISPADAVIGITQGSLDSFNREQLQGVVAHEFSHILNGDMRLNIRLAAMLKGITFIGDVGEVIVRGGTLRRGARRRDSKLPAQALTIGVALWILGWLGGLFAGFIKAALSRQREHLADASAVQFTRNPAGVAGALKVIGGNAHGSRIGEARAGELSHIFFGQIARRMSGLFDTHPPLDERIRRVEPGWDGQYILPRPVRDEAGEGEAEPADQRRRAAAAGVAGAVVGALATGAIRASDADFTGESDIDAAASPLHEIPESLAALAHDPFGANSLACALLLGDDAAVRESQYAIAESSGVRGLAAAVRKAYGELVRLDPSLRLSLLELCLPALKCMSAEQYRVFKETLLQITRADKRIDLYEWCLFQVVRHYLDPEFVQVAVSKPRHRKPAQVREEFRTVVSVLAWQGHTEERDRVAAFTRGVESVGLYGLTLRPLEECSVAEFSRAVNSLADCYPLLKPRLLKGMALCASHDDMLTAREVEILVAVGAVMDCPVPASIRAEPPLGR